MPVISTRRWLWIALVISAALLAIAYAIERFGGLPPCHPCLLQQRVHWAVVGVCVVGLVDRKSAWSGRVLLAVLGALFLIGAGIAVQQAWGERRWLSIAGWNALASLGLAGATGWVAARKR